MAMAKYLMIRRKRGGRDQDFTHLVQSEERGKNPFVFSDFQSYVAVLCQIHRVTKCVSF